MDQAADLEFAALRAFAGRLIPASAAFDVPGADDPAIFAEIVALLRPKLTALRDLIGELDRSGAPALAAEPLDSLLARIVPVHEAAFGLVAMAAIQAYYRDDRVMRSLTLEPRPPFPKGYVVEEGDFSLLEPVKARGPIWRRAR